MARTKLKTRTKYNENMINVDPTATNVDVHMTRVRRDRRQCPTHGCSLVRCDADHLNSEPSLRCTEFACSYQRSVYR